MVAQTVLYIPLSEREREKDAQSIHVVFGGLGSIQALCPSVLMGVGAGETYTTRLVAPLSLMDGKGQMQRSM